MLPGENPSEIPSIEREFVFQYPVTRQSIWRYEDGHYLGFPSSVSLAVASGLRLRGSKPFTCRYNKANELKTQQDAYCSKAIAGKWEGLGEFPQDLQWEALVDVVRGRVKVMLPASFFFIAVIMSFRFKSIATRLSILTDSSE